MQTAGRALAAIEILEEIAGRHRPAPLALADWAKDHRFAGSSDRAAIGNLVYDVLRKRASLGFSVGDDSAAALVAAALVKLWKLKAAEVEALYDGSKHAPAPLSSTVRRMLDAPHGEAPPPWVEGDYPEWLHASLARNFAERMPAEGAALSERAPIDLRVNTLKAARPKVLAALAKFDAAPTPFSPIGVRLPPRQGAARSPHAEAEAGHGKGWFEVQDEGSQIAALLSGAAPREQVLDLCAGAGGKTLALAAMMQNTGQIHAYDADPQRLRPIFERLRRAGARNVQTLSPGDGGALEKLAGSMDAVIVDAPCTGSGVWRRRADAKWRLSPEALVLRQAEQRQALAQGALLVKSGGRLIYVTCSLLPEENQDQMAWFQSVFQDFTPLPYAANWPESSAGGAPVSALPGHALLLTPAQHGTDGFFTALFKRS